MRLFFALPLPPDVKATLVTCQEGLRAAGLRASWPDPAGLHLTLAFLGEVTEARLPHLLDLGAEVAGRHARQDLRTASLGGFPQDDAARVLWVGVVPDAHLAALVVDLGRVLGERGFPVETQPFLPHLTLARPKAPTDLAAFGPGPEPLGLVVPELHLMESRRDHRGAVYQSRGAWLFRDRRPVRT